MVTGNNSVKVSEETQVEIPRRNLFVIERRDWERIKRFVTSIKSGRNYWENGGWFSASASITCLLAGYNSQDSVQTIFYSAAVATLIITIILFIASWAFSKDTSASSRQVLNEMADIEESVKENMQNIPHKGLQILSAFYGNDVNSVEVTGQLIDLINNNGLIVTASNDLAGDPAKGTTKSLRVEYSLNGKEYSRVVNEGELLKLP